MTEYRISISVLESIVRGALSADRRIRIHAPLPLTRTRPVEVNVEGDSCTVSVQLDARLGENLPSVAAEVRSVVASALDRMTGLAVGSVDVSFTSVFPAAR
jgi:uncharacterized alkaline shock family protein YloU